MNHHKISRSSFLLLPVVVNIFEQFIASKRLIDNVFGLPRNYLINTGSLNSITNWILSYCNQYFRRSLSIIKGRVNQPCWLVILQSVISSRHSIGATGIGKISCTLLFITHRRTFPYSPFVDKASIIRQMLIALPQVIKCYLSDRDVVFSRLHWMASPVIFGRYGILQITGHSFIHAKLLSEPGYVANWFAFLAVSEHGQHFSDSQFPPLTVPYR